MFQRPAATPERARGEPAETGRRRDQRPRQSRPGGNRRRSVGDVTMRSLCPCGHPCLGRFELTARSGGPRSQKGGTVVTWPPRVAETCAVSRLRRRLRPVTKTEVVLPRLQTRERERLVRLSLQVAGDGPNAVSAWPDRRRLRPMGRRPPRHETN